MPYVKREMAISHYLDVVVNIAKVYGNPFRIVDLPLKVVAGNNVYAKDTIARYVKWLEKSELVPTNIVEVKRVPDKKRGRVLQVYVNINLASALAKKLRENVLARIEERREKKRGERKDVEGQLNNYRKKIRTLSKELKEKRIHIKEL